MIKQLFKKILIHAPIKKKLFPKKNFLNIINIIKKQIKFFSKNFVLLGIPFILIDYFIREETKN